MNVADIESALKADEETREKFQEVLIRIHDTGETESAIEAMTKAAREIGFDVTTEEMEQYAASLQQVDEGDLEQVSGGTPWSGTAPDGHDAGCVTIWYCFTISMHTDNTNHDTRCWSDYKCAASEMYKFYDGWGPSCFSANRTPC